jgi:hypothetical protein
LFRRDGMLLSALRQAVDVGCNTMKTLLIIVLSLSIVANCFAQKVRLEGDNSPYLCLNDSVTHMFENSLQGQNVDSIISILYDYDNGRLPTSKTVTIWTHYNESNIRIVQGCDILMKDTAYSFNASDLWSYIRDTRFESVSIPIESGWHQSHDTFYHITVTTPQKSFFVVVRDFERKSKEKTAQTDTRVILTNMIDTLLK